MAAGLMLLDALLIPVRISLSRFPMMVMRVT
jgi:hypothetical protein